jgi:hypothetical protein
MNFKTLKISFAGLAMGLLLWPGCSVNVTTSSTSDSTAVSTPAAAEPAAAPEISGGTYCYSYKDETLALTAEMEYDGAIAKGTLWGVIDDKANGYFSSYVTDFEGARNGGNLDVSTKTEIEGDVQEEKASWAWDGETLTEGEHKMAKVICEPHEE